MELYVFSCCGNGNVVRKISTSEKNKDRIYYTCPLARSQYFVCGYFVWEDELRHYQCGQGLCIAHKNQNGVSYKCPMDDNRNCGYDKFVTTWSSPTQGSSSQGSASTPRPSASGSASRPSGCEAECSNCKFLSLKINILEARLKVAMNPDQSAEVLNGLFENLNVE